MMTEDMEVDGIKQAVGRFGQSCCGIVPSMVSKIFKPPPPVGAGGGYMFPGRPSVPLSIRASMIHVVVLCFRDISSIC